MAIQGWRLLRAGPGARTALAVDFTLAKVRAQANFGDLAPRLPDGYAVWGSDETGWPASAGRLRAQLDDWLGRGEEFGEPVRAVLGFCASAALACALADRLAGRAGARPAVVLFDPVTVGPRTMYDQFEASMRRMGTPAGAPDGPHDLGELATDLARRYESAARAACAAQGVPESIAGQLCRRVETNLRFLGLCATAGLGATTPDVVVLSRDHAVPAALRGADEVRLDTPQEELLAHPDAASAAARVLTEAVAERR